MDYIKDNFEKIINKHGHNILVKHANKNISCPNNKNDMDHNTDCSYCYGLNYKYSFYKAKVRRSNNNIYRDNKDEKEPISFSAGNKIYYFKTEYDFDEDDFIIEYQNNDIEVYKITSKEPHYGINGNLAFYSSVVVKQTINKEIVKKDILRLKHG